MKVTFSFKKINAVLEETEYRTVTVLFEATHDPLTAGQLNHQLRAARTLFQTYKEFLIQNSENILKVK